MPGSALPGPSKRLCVYCGTNVGTSPAYLQAATDLGTTMATRGIGLVYGGGRLGLMGAVADAVMKHAGKTVLVVGHSNTVAAIVAALGGPKMTDLCDTQYSLLITMVIDGHTVRVIRSSYGIATPDTPEVCSATGSSVRPPSGAK